MDPEIWRQLPNDLIERIAQFADIDTRRAMGFLPRKLPPSKLVLPKLIEYENYFSKYGESRKFIMNGASFYVYPDDPTWAFGREFHSSGRTYIMRDNGLILFYLDGKLSRVRHPDFNDDGSFKRSRPC